MAPIPAADLLAVLRTFGTSEIASAISALGVRLDNVGFSRGDLQCRFPALPPMLGHAVTAKVHCANPPMEGRQYPIRRGWWEYLTRIPAPRILVLQDADPSGAGSGALIGAVQGHMLRAFGYEGLLTDGAVRDLDGIGRISGPAGNFQVFSRSLVPALGYAHLVEIGCEVDVGGVAIPSGTLIHGDRDGFVTIPAGLDAAIPQEVERQRAGERRIIAVCQSPSFSVEALKACCDSVYGGADAHAHVLHP